MEEKEKQDMDIEFIYYGVLIFFMIVVFSIGIIAVIEN